MKKSSLILAIIFLISMCSLERISAQEKSKEEKDKELQELIDEQKKAMVEQKKVQEEAMKEARKEIEKSNFEVQKAMQNLKDLKVDVGDPQFQDQIMKVYRNYNGTPFLYTPGFDFYGRHPGDDSERTSWEFSKSVKETSFNRDYIIDVEKSVSNVVMSVVGDCKMGEIRIKIVMPNGKTYSDIVIDEFGNLNWKKSFNVSESENEDKTGPWKFEIKSSKAIGYFKISLQTY